MANEAICSLEMRKVGSSDSVYRAKKHKAATISMGPVLCVFLKLMSCLDDLTILVYLGDDMQSAAQRVESVDGLRSCMLACLSFFWPFAILEAVSLVDELGGHQKQMKQHSKRHLAFG